MDKELLRNGAGYIDYTAYKAIKNCEQENERMGNEMEYKRGEIFEYENGVGNIKKALVVSADFRATGRYISIIVLSEEMKGENMVPVVCGGQMYADCGMVSFSTNERLGRYLRSASDAEMAQVDEGIARCLGLEQKIVEVPTIPVESLIEVTPDGFHCDIEAVEELATVRAEANVYKNLYEQLLAKMLG